MGRERNRVLMVVNSYAPDDPRVIFTAQSLVQMGYQVVLVGAARQRSGDVPVYHEVNGVQVFITPMVPSLHPLKLISAMWALLRGKHGEITLSSPHIQTGIVSMLFFNLWIVRVGLGRRFDVIHCHDLSPLPGCWLLAKVFRKRLIYDAHEDAVTMYGGGKGRAITRLERWLLPGVDQVISAGIRLIPALKERGAKRVELIGNWKRLGDYVVSPDKIAAERERLGIKPGDFVVTYIGTLDPSREILPLVDAVSESSDVKLIIGGRGILQGEVEQAAQKSPNILWLGWVNLMDVPLYTHMADVIYHCRAMDKFQEKNYIAPAANKVFEAFAAGKPLMASRGVNEVADILEETGAGYFLDALTAESIKAALDDLKAPATRDALNDAARKARDLYNWGIAETRLAEIYSRLTER